MVGLLRNNLLHYTNTFNKNQYSFIATKTNTKKEDAEASSKNRYNF